MIGAPYWNFIFYILFYMLQKLIFLSEFFVLMHEHFCNFLHLVLEILSTLSCGIAFYTFVLTMFLWVFLILLKINIKNSCIFQYFNPTTFYWKACSKPGKWSVMHISVEDIGFVSISTNNLLFWRYDTLCFSFSLH